MIIKTERLYLREMPEDDFDELQSIDEGLSSENIFTDDNAEEGKADALPSGFIIENSSEDDNE